MELEFRNKDGIYLFTVKGLFYITVYTFLMGCSDFNPKKSIKIIWQLNKNVLPLY